MSDELLPLVNTLELRGRSSEVVKGKAISVETQIRWKIKKLEAPAILLRELAVLLIEEGLRILRGVHETTIPRGGVDRVIEWDR